MKDPKNLMNFLVNKKETGMYKASIIRRFEEIFELYPNLRVGEVIHYVLKSTGDLTNCHNWTDSNFLKKIENVQRQLSDSYNFETEKFDKNDDLVDDEFLKERVQKFPTVYGK